MKENIIQVTQSVKWIGALDPTLAVFDVVMTTQHGTTYNAYFIDADKKALIDSVKHTHTNDYIARVRSLCNPADIEYIILNHTEPDHAGSTAALLEMAPNATLVGSGRALAYITEIVNRPLGKTMQIKGGETISLGNRKLKFIAAPNLHWPDTIYTFLEDEGVLFTCDSFGAHYCFDALFDDLLPNKNEYLAAFDYYFDCILRPFSKFMLKAIEKISPLAINVICPGHGVILRTMWREMVDRSRVMASQYMDMIGSSDNIFVCYVSAYGYTRAMAQQIAAGIEKSGIQAALMDIEFATPDVIEAALAKAKALVVGSPTINQNTLLPIYKLFAAVNPLRDRGKMAAAFGSYGWSGEAADIIEANLRSLGFRMALPALKVKFNPSETTLQEFRDFGSKMAEKIMSNEAA